MDVWNGPTTMTIKDPEDVQPQTSEAPVSEEIPLMINAMKKMYKDKLLPFEERYNYSAFSSPSLTDAYFDAKPFVLLIGQYSVGKTTFIRYLLERDFPGVRIGPEPTTDRFMVVMHGPTDRRIPGNALCADASKPFTQLAKFGTGFLNKFECAECRSPILEKISFIDTPGILSGEKQRTGRGYDFPVMCKWFASRSDRILLLFDAHKLDVSDELKTTIDLLRENDDKVRVVLNKADIPTQQLIRVYGALMWSLGKVFKTPEVLRVYVGSFWDKPLKEKENEALMDLEERDLLSDLRTLPQNVAIRKVNELIKRTRRAKIHALIIVHLKSKFGVFGKVKKQKQILENLGAAFTEVKDLHGVPRNDFPNLELFKDVLQNYEINNFPKMKPGLLETVNDMLSKDMPKLMSMIPGEIEDDESESKDGKPNPFRYRPEMALGAVLWAIQGTDKKSYKDDFDALPQTNGKVQGVDLQKALSGSGLPVDTLGQVWELSDIDCDGAFDIDEYCVARFMIADLKNERLTTLPKRLPNALIPPSKRYLFTMDGESG